MGETPCASVVLGPLGPPKSPLQWVLWVTMFLLWLHPSLVAWPEYKPFIAFLLLMAGASLSCPLTAQDTSFPEYHRE